MTFKLKRVVVIALGDAYAYRIFPAIQKREGQVARISASIYTHVSSWSAVMLMVETGIADQPIVIIHPGSLNLRIGTASSQTPFTILHCIARKRSNVVSPDRAPFPIPHRVMELIAAERQITEMVTECGLSDKESLRDSEGVIQSANEASANYESGKPTVISPVTQHLNKADADIYVGEAALCQSSDRYHLNWPLRAGHFDSSRPSTAVLRDLQDIWTCTLERHLGIARSNFSSTRAILLIPDAFLKRELSGLANLLLVEMGFAAVVFHQENVCATFGIGLPSACVVDVGHQKVSISCVEDGISLAESRIWLPYGGEDITKAVMQWLRTVKALPEEVCLGQDGRGEYITRKVKEAIGRLEILETNDAGKEYTVEANLPDLHVKATFTVGGEEFLAPMMIFCPTHFNKPVSYSLEEDATPTQNPCWDDPLEDLMLISRQTSNSNKKKGGVNRRRKTAETDTSSGYLPPLDEAIFTSINRVESEETRLKLLCCVVVVGAGLSFPGANRCLEALLLKRQWEKHLSPNQRASLDSPRPDVITQFKDLGAGDAAWMGGAIMTKVDFVQELWITPDDWTRHGTRILREMSPFQW